MFVVDAKDVCGKGFYFLKDEIDKAWVRGLDLMPIFGLSETTLTSAIRRTKSSDGFKKFKVLVDKSRPLEYTFVDRNVVESLYNIYQEKVDAKGLDTVVGIIDILTDNNIKFVPRLDLQPEVEGNVVVELVEEKIPSSSSDISIFNYENTSVRTVTDEAGSLWFVAKDVCDILGLGDVHKSVERLDSSMKGTNSIRTPSGVQQMITLTEAGVYRLTFSSRKPNAEKFMVWLAKDVVPSIRKTGQYSVMNKSENNPFADFVPKTHSEALRLAADALDEVEKKKAELKQLEAVVSDKEKQIVELDSNLEVLFQKTEEDKPKVEFYDRVTKNKEDLLDMKETAKVLGYSGVGRNVLFHLLRGFKVLMNDNQPYQAHVDQGHFMVLEREYRKEDRCAGVYLKTMVTQKGLAFIRDLLEEHFREENDE